MDVQRLSDSLGDYKEEQDNIRVTLDSFKTEFDRAMVSLQEKQSRLEMRCEDLKGNQDIIREEMSTKDEEHKMHWEITKKVQSLCRTLEDKSSFMQRDLDLLIKTVNSMPHSEDVSEIVFDAPEQSKWFTGREKEIENLERCLPSDNGKALSMAAVCGLGGCGKSTLATHFAWKHKAKYEGGVFWFSMEDDRKFENSVSDLALRLQIQANSFDLTLSKVLTWISKREKPWLLVLDDVDQLNLSEQMHKVLYGRWKRQTGGHILLTTRREPKEVSESINLEPSRCVNVYVFSEDEARRFLIARIGFDDVTGQHEALNDLVRELGLLPLALEQAGAHIKALLCPVVKYLEEYKILRLNLLSQHPAKPSWEYESQTRLAVHTTWLLNFEYVRKSPRGEAASNFVQAAAFLAPNEIQEELINSQLLSADDPPSQKSNRSLLKNHIVETLTKFSLFQRKSPRSLGLHRLVQEVIRNRMSSQETASSLFRAVRLVHQSFCDCPSPDQILADITTGVQEQPSSCVTNPSLFYLWSKLTSHASELQQHLRAFLDQKDIGNEVKTIVLTRQTSRVIYENAVQLSVHGHQEDAKETERFAFQILDSYTPSDGNPLSPEDFSKLFPHTLPLPQMLQKTVLYSSRPPPESQNIARNENPQSAVIDELRLRGNACFNNGCFKEAVETYTEALEGSKGTNHPDPRLLNNRATAYLKLGRFEECLQDSEEYISIMPNCWKGYTRKALALNGLGIRIPALCSAAIAYYHDTKCCRRYETFRNAFKDLDGKWEVVDSSETLKRSLLNNKKESSRKKVLVLTNSKYEIADGALFTDIGSGGSMFITYTTLTALGNGSNVTINCDSLFLNKSCFFQNITFSVNNLVHVAASGNVEFHRCTFQNSVSDQPVISILGEATFLECTVRDSKGSGIAVAGPNSSATLLKCQISGNGKMDPYSFGIRVFNEGRLMVHKCHIYGNIRGIWLDEGPTTGVPAKGAIITDSEIYDNKYEGVVVGGVTWSSPVSPVVIMRRNKIYHNGMFGVRATLNINDVLLEENMVFENLWWGICIHNDSGGLYKGNEICNNKMGGMMVGKQSPGKPPCVVENNFIHDNCGPAFHEGIRPSERDSFPGELQHVFTKTLQMLKLGLQPRRDVPIPNAVSAEFNFNQCLRNDLGQKHFKEAALKKYCAFCFRRDVELKSCKRCMTATYCGKKCQELHWEKHKYTCKATGKRNAIEVPLPTIEYCMTSRTFQGLDPTGPNYAPPPPRDGSRFIVKVQTLEAGPFGDIIDMRGFVSNEQDPNKARMIIYDRSRHVNFYTSCKPRIYHLIMECGMMGVSMSLTKKLYCWAAFKDGKTLRIFTHEFPQVQEW